MTLDKQHGKETVVLKLSQDEVRDNSNLDFNDEYLVLSKIYPNLESDE